MNLRRHRRNCVLSLPLFKYECAKFESSEDEATNLTDDRMTRRQIDCSGFGARRVRNWREIRGEARESNHWMPAREKTIKKLGMSAFFSDLPGRKNMMVRSLRS